ncbi:dATP/dGTP diphosphohydrolase domain-containing protein [Verrucomicrobium sp. BvORR106]|uniref:dATP/dGTP diphosphohydrolase domain-containing protein n=1 Tax=Verrucomicrobium sp. BvORR106 TaxID=1403819 RepID=UPI00056EB4A6|nr:dATP/dGTP diphosphohydrolase domain-containing protein [Verrucomicrobium sp. BvORR106]
MTLNTNIPDSGTRSQFITGAVRDAAPGKGLPSNIPPIAIRALARRFEDGAQKYGPRNWMQGIPLSRYIDAIIRHTLSMSEGRTDEDHAGAVLWNAAAFMWTRQAVENGKLPNDLNDLIYDEAG